MTGPGGMATPLHHDQPQRALRNLGVNSEEHTENSKSRRDMWKNINSPPQHDENLANQPFSSYRRSTQQLPSRPGHHRQSHLRQRRPESSSPHAPLEESPRNALSSSQSDRPYTNSVSEEFRSSFLDHPNALIAPDIYLNYAGSFPKESQPSYPDHPHAGSPPEGPSHHAGSSQPVVSMCNNQIHRVNEEEEEALPSWQRHQPELQSSGAATKVNHHVHVVKACKEYQPLQSLATRNSRPLDYKAAILRDVSGSRALKDLPHANHDNYFGSTEDDKRQSQLKNSAKALLEQQQQVNIDPCKIRHGNASDNSHEVAEQKESLSHIATSFSVQATLEDQAEINAECVHMASEQWLQAESRELSHSSSEDGFCHISKEAVEQEYQNDCHIATLSEDQAQCQGQPCSRLIYDYARAGVTLVDDNPNEQQSDNLCSNKEGVSNGEEGINNQSKSAQDDQRGHDSQHQDVESPPLFLGFNHSSTRFACGTSKGLRVYDINTMRECFVCAIGGVSLVEMLSNMDPLILVGGGPNPSFPLNKVVMWDAINGKSAGQITQKFPILAVKAQQDRLVVVLENEVCVYNISNAKLLFQVNTTSNIKGLCALSTKEGPSVMACPGLKKGEVRIEHIGTNRNHGDIPTRDSIDISAHDSGLACVALNPDGSLLATASDRGTLVRIFNAKDGAPLQELRRGSDRAVIYSLAFSFSSDWLAVSSDKGTVHIFGVRTVGSNSTDTNGVVSPTSARNPGSTLSFIKGVLPKYFRSEWSYAQFKLSEEMKSVVAFGQEKHSVLVLGTDGSFYKCSFDSEQGGDMKQLEVLNFLTPREAEA